MSGVGPLAVVFRCGIAFISRLAFGASRIVVIPILGQDRKRHARLD